MKTAVSVRDTTMEILGVPEGPQHAGEDKSQTHHILGLRARKNPAFQSLSMLSDSSVKVVLLTAVKT